MDRDEYISTGRNTVAGWFGQADGLLFCALSGATDGFGHLLEIGAYLGRSSILLGYLTQPGERLVVCDLFGADAGETVNDSENRAAYPGLALEDFTASYQRFHMELPEIIVDSSLNLTPERLKGPFRFVHIDGSHLYARVRSDILLAKQAMRPDGVVSLDDSRSRVGVFSAIWEAVANDGLIPICFGDKMYATWDRDAAERFVTTAVALMDTDARFHYQMVEVRGHEFPELVWFDERTTRDKLAEAIVPPGARKLAARLH